MLCSWYNNEQNIVWLRFNAFFLGTFFLQCTWTEVLHIHVHYCLFLGHGQYELEVAASVSTRAPLSLGLCYAKPRARAAHSCSPRCSLSFYYPMITK